MSFVPFQGEEPQAENNSYGHIIKGLTKKCSEDEITIIAQKHQKTADALPALWMNSSIKITL